MDFDPRHPEFRANPYPFYDLLRSYAPVFYWEAWGIWFLTRYDDCSALLRDDRLGHAELIAPPEHQRPLWEMQFRWMLLRNPPDHTRLRSLVHKAFTPRMVEQMRQRIQAITDDLLDQVQAAGRMDLIGALAYPLPVTVIAQMLGVPAADQDKFHGWSNALARSLDLTEDEAVYNRASDATVEFRDYLKHLVDRRRADPQDDLLSALVFAEEAGDRLTEEELYANCMLLLTAGHETTINLIGNGTLALLRQPEQLDRLKQEPALVRTAVEELLRYDSPVQMTSRFASEDMEVGGQLIHEGQTVAFLLGAANRDPERFESPNKVDVGRQPNPHLAFGGGIHYCLGAPLARLEAQIAFSTLLRRMPNLKLETDAPPYRDNYILRGLESLPVSF
ncbi:MAG: cytochrome P450 [Chloroflexi bacterium]|nr:cytochrome P450 [Chloroflexota bacterium]MCI0579709.1 cytochrome P450 [Chloroflexota bacterium]MCI0644142.1 cytochrome P450 [Chloroflexota bacterium]MCI0726232.1 cytochrome P450 [Chloroflexota bacterium]